MNKKVILIGLLLAVFLVGPAMAIAVPQTAEGGGTAEVPMSGQQSSFVQSKGFVEQTLGYGGASCGLEGFEEWLPDTAQFQVTFNYGLPPNQPYFFQDYVFGTGTSLDTGSYGSPGATPYDGWCMNAVQTIYPVNQFGTSYTYTAGICSSTDTACIAAHNCYDTGCTLKYMNFPEKLPNVNYILNNYQVGGASPGCGGTYTYGDIQYAMWKLVFGPVPSDELWTLGSGWTDCKVNEIYNDANANGGSFVPGCGDKIAIVFFPYGPTSAPQAVIAQAVLGELGVPCCSSIGDYVWEDTNVDGIQDIGEPGIAGVTVELYKSDGTFVASTTTDANGKYLFETPPADYYVKFIAPDGYAFTLKDQGSNDAIDSDADTTIGQTAATTLTAGETDLTWDAGMYQPASLGDFVWEDTNANGIQDAGEAGIPGVTIELYTCTGTLVGSTTTDASGIYGFTNLVPGDYYMVFIKPAGYVLSPQDVGSDDSVDSDADTTFGMSACTTLIPGENDVTWDAGMYQPASIGDRVWEDTNADGVQDAGEAGIPGVIVELYTCTGTLVGSTTTDASGIYGFTNLVPGDYYVEFIKPAGYVLSPIDLGGDDTKDSDAETTTGRTICTTIDSGENDMTWDAGMYQPASLGDFVWEDTNANGIQDDGEAGIPGVIVELYTCTGTLVGSTTTDASGIYGFTNLVPGDYYVVFIKPSGYVLSPQDVGSDDSVDSDADTTSGMSACTTLIPGENDVTWDAGMYLPIPCLVEVTKNCAIPTPPPTTFGACSDAKPLDTMIVKWNGAVPIYVKAWNGAVGTGSPTLIGSAADPIMPGEIVTYTRSGSYPNDIYWQLFNAADGSVYHAVTGDKGLSTFHLSCSDVDMNGPEDCGKTAGDGKALTGYVNQWIFGGLGGNGRTLVCQGFEPEPQPSDLCTFAPQVTPFVCSGAKPISSMTVKWNGLQQSVYVKAWNGAVGTGTPQTFGPLSIGQEVTFTRSGTFPNDIYFEIFTDEAMTAKLGKSTFHLSCSDVDMNGPEDCRKTAGDGKALTGYLNQWIFEGMAGNGKVLDCSGLDLSTTGTDVTYLYTITNPLSSSITVTSAEDDKIGSILTDQITLGPYESKQFVKSYFVVPDINNLFVNKVTVTARTTTGATCEADDTATVQRILPYVDVKGDSVPTLDGTKFYWKLHNYGTATATITKVSVTAWPSQQGKLKKIMLDTKTAADPADIPWPGPATITSFVSDITTRQITAGQIRTFTIEFEKSYLLDTNTQYKVTITFEGGSTVSWNMP